MRTYTEKVRTLLQHKFNLYHADYLMELLEDSNINEEDFLKQVKLIERCEANDIDEYDTLRHTVSEIAFYAFRHCSDSTDTISCESGFKLPTKHDDEIIAFYYDDGNEEFVVVGKNQSYWEHQLEDEDLIIVLEAIRFSGLD